jgi:peptide/nickel transport system substrate-binding protein
MKKHHIFSSIFVVVLVASLLAACGPAATATPQAATSLPAASQVVTAAEPTQPVASETPSVAPTSAGQIGGDLTVGIGVEPETLDPGDAVYIDEQFILISLFDSLLSIAPDSSLHPGLALSWEPNAAYTEFTFKLRKDVKFHDGTAFNAAAVKASFDHIVNDVLESGGKTELVDHKYKETVLVDDYTVTVKFEAPYPTFLRDAARQWLSISSPAALLKYGKDYGHNPVGTGPFKFVKWDVQSQIVLERNPDYAWGPEFAAHQGPAYLNTLTFRILPEAATRLTTLQTGEILVAEEPPALDAIALVDQGQAVVKTFSSPGLPSHMMINTEKAPTNDLNVRKAMIYAVNQEELVTTAFKSLGVPAHSVVSSTTWAYNADAAALYKYDPAEAGRLLDEAGWKDTNGDGIREKNGQKLHLTYVMIPAWEEAFSELLAGYLQKVGFEVEIKTTDDAGASAEAGAGNHNLINMGWIRVDPSPLKILFDSANIKGGSAYTRFNNPELDKVLRDADSQTDEAVRKQDYETAQTIIMENALVIPLFNYNRVFLLAPTVQGFSFDLEGYPYLYDVTLGK